MRLCLEEITRSWVKPGGKRSGAEMFEIRWAIVENRAMKSAQKFFGPEGVKELAAARTRTKQAGRFLSERLGEYGACNSRWQKNWG